MIKEFNGNVSEEKYVAVVFALAGLLILVYAIFPALLRYAIPCPIKYFTGFDCPGCGMTRACVLMAQGEYYTAVKMNPLVVYVVGWSSMRFINSVLSIFLKVHVEISRFSSCFLQIMFSITWLYVFLARVCNYVAYVNTSGSRLWFI